MLVAFYVISAISSVFAYICMFLRKEENIKYWFSAIILSLLTSLSFYIPMISKIITTFPNINFWDVFAVVSLVAWQSAFIFNHTNNLINYEVAVLLFAMIISIICPTFDASSYRTFCNEEHIDVDVIYIYDDNSSDNLITKTIHSNTLSATYSFYLISEYGKPFEKTIFENVTTIYTIDNGASPYLEIVVSSDCDGFNIKTQKHYLSMVYTHYNLYIPEDCITVIFEKTDN